MVRMTRLQHEYSLMALEVKQAEHSDPGGFASLLRHLCDDEGEGSILLP